MTPETRIRDRLLSGFPFLQRFPRSELDAVIAASTAVSAKPGDTLLQPGDPCESSALVLGGSLRVFTRAANGRALMLYTVIPGEMCALTSMCLLTGQPFPAYAEAVVDTTVLVVPRAQFQRLLDIEDRWRRFAFDAVWNTVAGLLTRIDDVVFTDLPTRMAAAMLAVENAGVVPLTHARLAEEAGSTREAVSRVLKRWEQEGVVTLLRGRLIVHSIEHLRHLASG